MCTFVHVCLCICVFECTCVCSTTSVPAGRQQVGKRRSATGRQHDPLINVINRISIKLIGLTCKSGVAVHAGSRSATVGRGSTQYGQQVRSCRSRQSTGRGQVFFLFLEGEGGRKIGLILKVFFRKIRCPAIARHLPYAPSSGVRSWGSAESGPWST
jgi:hypothetical protein